MRGMVGRMDLVDIVKAYNEQQWAGSADEMALPRSVLGSVVGVDAPAGTVGPRSPEVLQASYQRNQVQAQQQAEAQMAQQAMQQGPQQGPAPKQPQQPKQPKPRRRLQVKKPTASGAPSPDRLQLQQPQQGA